MTATRRATHYLLPALLTLAACDGDGGPRSDPAAGDRDTTVEVADHPGDPAGGEGEERSTGDVQMGDGAGPSVRLEPGQAEQIGLRWGRAAREPLVRTVRTSAVLEYPESEMVWVSPKVPGWVEKLHVTYEGAPVRAGQPLLDLYSPELVTAQEELLLAGRLDGVLHGRAENESLERVARRRLEYWDISADQIDRLLATGEVRKTMSLRAPVTGVVTRKRVFEGQGVKGGENLFMIAPTDPVWIEAAVRERDLPFVREGLPVELSVEGLPGRTLRGRVSYLYPELRESTRTVVARVEVPNPRGELRPGMYATARIATRTDSVLSVPASAILRTGARNLVFLEVGRTRLAPRAVETGREGDQRVEVLSGLTAGDRVAASAQFLLDSEANLMEAMQAMMAEMGRRPDDGMDGIEMERMEESGDGREDARGPGLDSAGADGADDAGHEGRP